MNIRLIAQALGGDVVGSNSILCPGPQHSAKDRSLCVTFPSDDQFVVHSHAGDDWQECRDHVRKRLNLEWNFSRSDPIVTAPDTSQEERIQFALRLWQEAIDPHGTAVERYLSNRGLQIDDGLAGAVLRYHSALRYNGSTTPGMIALYRDIVTNEPCGIHRTFLDRDGRKIDRKMLGRAKGAAIKLDADENVTSGLTIGEGVETCMSGRVGGFRPAWALGSADAIASFPVLPGIDALTILGETDATGANDRATLVCAQRWLNARREVRSVKPRNGGDVNDVLQGVVAR